MACASLIELREFVETELAKIYKAEGQLNVAWLVLDRRTVPREVRSGRWHTYRTILGDFPLRWGNRFEIVRPFETARCTTPRVQYVEMVRADPWRSGDGFWNPCAAQVREAKLHAIAYTFRSKRFRHRAVTLQVPMAEVPGRRLFYMEPTIYRSQPYNALDARWLERMTRRVQRIKVETLWRHWTRTQPHTP